MQEPARPNHRTSPGADSRGWKLDQAQPAEALDQNRRRLRWSRLVQTRNMRSSKARALTVENKNPERRVSVPLKRTRAGPPKKKPRVRFASNEKQQKFTTAEADDLKKARKPFGRTAQQNQQDTNRVAIADPTACGEPQPTEGEGVETVDQKPRAPSEPPTQPGHSQDHYQDGAL